MKTTSDPPLEERIKAAARNLGFSAVGITTPDAPETLPAFRSWLERGYAGQMHYMERHAAARGHPASVYPQVRSIIVVAAQYGSGGNRDDQASMGRVARYAQCRDYHDVLRSRLKHLLARIQEWEPSCRGRAVVDTAPLLERDLARRAGLGWFGKNTMLIHKRLGSYFLLGALLVDIELRPDPPFTASHCGTCTACLDACPTDALVAPGELDSRRCISYLTIEVKGDIPEAQRPWLGDWAFGCDICQEVCPWNRKSPEAAIPELRSRPELEHLDLVELFSLDEAAFDAKYGDTPLSRPGRDGLLRNAAIVLANRADASVLPVLRKALARESGWLRETIAWAISRIEDRLATSGDPKPCLDPLGHINV